MNRRLMFFLDGTSNRAVGPKVVLPTNIFRLNQAFTFGFGGTPQITFYFSGVGTRGDVLSRATGAGFDQIITEAYINLSSNFMEAEEGIRDSDTIYLFGFSRGAAAARALSEMISYPGLLHADGLSVFPTVWKLFVDDKLDAGERNVLEQQISDKLIQPRPKIEFLGVFDMVAGSSWDTARMFASVRARNPRLDKSVKSAVHLLSIDDDRNPSFSPLLWKGKSSEEQFLEQLWMPGVHADVGGASDGIFIGHVALLTMIERITNQCPELEWDDDFIDEIIEQMNEVRAVEITSERTGFLRKLLRSGPRVVGSGAFEYLHPLTNLLANKEIYIRKKNTRSPKRVYKPTNYQTTLANLEIAKFSPAHVGLLSKACEKVLEQ